MRATKAIGLGLMLLSCGGDPCSQKSPCPNDPAQTADAIQQCRDAIADGAKCQAESKAVVDCINAKTKCTAAGVTDGTQLMADCNSQYSAQAICLTATPDGGSP